MWCVAALLVCSAASARAAGAQAPRDVGPSFRLVNASGAVVELGDLLSWTCPYGAGTFATVRNPASMASLGVCRAFADTLSCCPESSDLYDWIAKASENLAGDPCCQLNVERLLCFIACHPAVYHAASSGASTAVVHARSAMADLIRDSCQSTNDTIGNVTRLVSRELNVSLSWTPHPQTGLAIDMDVMQSCAQPPSSRMGNATGTCSSCFAIAHRTVVDEAALAALSIAQATNSLQGYCGPSSSDTSRCCVNNNFTWSRSGSFILSSRSHLCTANIRRLQCACLCSGEADHTSWKVDAAVYYVHPNESQLLYEVCSDAGQIVDLGGVNISAKAAMPTSKQFLAWALVGISRGKNVSFVEDEDRGVSGAVVALFKDASLKLYSFRVGDTGTSYTLESSSSSSPFPRMFLFLGAIVPSLFIVFTVCSGLVIFGAHCMRRSRKPPVVSIEMYAPQRQFAAQAQPPSVPANVDSSVLQSMPSGMATSSSLASAPVSGTELVVDEFGMPIFEPGLAAMVVPPPPSSGLQTLVGRV